MARLQDRRAVVTGGASGFGRGIAEAFVREGARVVVADLDLARAREAAASLDASEERAIPRAVDVADTTSVAALMGECEARWGALDILVANAGVGQRPQPLEKTPDAEFQRQFAANAFGVFSCCRAAIPLLRRGVAPSIVVTASGIVLRPRPNLVAYGASKAAGLAIARGLALELASDGIRVNAICPGPGDTPMLDEFMGGEATPEKREAFRSALPLGLLIRPEDAGESALFLADERASGRMTGVALPIDSGRTI